LQRVVQTAQIGVEKAAHRFGRIVAAHAQNGRRNGRNLAQRGDFGVLSVGRWSARSSAQRKGWACRVEYSLRRFVVCSVMLAWRS
jgi:hypothetical protein